MKLLIPTMKQFNSWTMLNRIGYVAAVFGIPVAIIQLSIWGYGLFLWFQPASMQLSPSELVIIDQNPTKLMISEVVIKEYDSNNKIVVFKLKNDSKVTAKNVSVDFYNYLNKKSLFTKGIRYLDNGTGIDIPAGETRAYKVAYLKDYEDFFNPDSPGSRLLRVSKDVNLHNPFELNAIACGVIDGEIPTCSYSSSGRSTIVSIKYGSIFGQKYKFITQFYNNFLDGEVSYNQS